MKKCLKLGLLAAASLVCMTSVRLSGQPVAPAALDERPLRYRLLPDLSEQTPGNAAPVYLTATTLAEGRDPKFWDSIDALLDKPTTQWPCDEAHRIVNERVAWLEILDVAARREKCEWDIPLRELTFRALLPHLNTLRALTYILQLRTRLAIIEGRWDDAACSLQTTMALSEHLTHDSILVQTLVGAGIRNLACESLREWVGTPGSPNLYWSLVHIPSMSSKISEAMERERASFYFAFPALRKPESGMTTEQWNRMALEAVKWSTQAASTTRPALPDAKSLADVEVEGLMASAQAFLLRGVAEERLTKLHPAALVGSYAADECERAFDDTSKWLGLSYRQGIDGLQASEAAGRQTLRTGPNPLLRLVPANVSRAWTSLTRTDRTVAALVGVEAVRAYALAHGGQTPAELVQISDTPVPLDPITGKPFVYQTRPNGFTIESPPAPSVPSIRYEVLFKP